MTTQATSTIEIRATPEAVWPWIGQLGKHAEWSPKPYSVEHVSGDLDAAGSRYRSVGWVPGEKEHVMDVVLTEVVPAQRLVLHADDQQGTFTNTFDLRPTATGTEVTFHIVFPPMKGMAAVLVPVLFPIVGKSDIRKRMQLLKAKVESSSPSPS